MDRFIIGICLRFLGVIVALCLLLPGTVAAAPHYGLNDIGTFGDGENWNFNQPIALINDGVDQYDVRFTAMEPITIDRVFQRLIGQSGSINGTGTTVSVRIVKDDGSGDPSTVGADQLTTSGVVTATEGIAAISFPQVTLTTGQVYHVVTKGETVNQAFNVFSSTAKQAIRPYDRAVDTQFSIARRLNQDVVFFPNWLHISLDPFIYFANGSDANVVGGPTQPYTFPNPTASFTQGDGGVKAGQRFVITDKEVPAGMTVGVKQITMSVIGSDGDANGMENLLIRFRKLDGTILGTATMTKAQMDGTSRTLNLDQLVSLQQGVPYLVTTDVAGTGGTASDIYFIRTLTGNTGSGAATWGGTTDAYEVFSTNGWASFSTYAADWDMIFSFQAQVPEPTSLALFAGGVLFLAGFRRLGR